MNPQQRPDDPIKHVVLLMFENHSFDQMLGCFKKVYPGLEGVDPARPNVNRDGDGNEFKQEETRERQMILDPRHEVNHVAVQMEDHNGGFVRDLVASSKNDKNLPKDVLDKQCQFVMGYYPLDFLPALHGLGRDFLICDHWHSSLPGPTWPNRFFALTGTSQGRVNMPEDGEHTVDFEGWFQQSQDTLFDRLSEQGISWKLYFHDIPLTVCLTHQRRPENAARCFPITEFYKDARGAEAEFPAFCHIEPDYNGFTENDDHPPHDIMKAQKLLADVYNALRSNENLWESTLLVVVYDEHGGVYDHIEPPVTIPPDDHHEEYAFDQLGIRVPAILVSPWVKRGFDSTVFDHTSLLRYLREKWNLGSLGSRTSQANSISSLIQTGEPRTDTVDWIDLSPDELRPPDPVLEEEAAGFLSSHHRALALIGQYLKAEIDEELPRIYTYCARLWEAVRSWWRGNATTTAAVLQAYEKTKAQCLVFLDHRKKQSVSILSVRIKDAKLPEHARNHAAETLGYVVDRKFHREKNPLLAAQQWLQKHGK